MRRAMPGRIVIAALVAAACAAAGAAACGRGGGAGRGRDGGDDGGAVAAAAVPAVPVVVRDLGTATLDAYGWRAGPGKAAFDRALAAEKRGDLPAIEREASAALAADPSHLEAAWVAAVARARLGRHDAVVAALEIAAAGDWAKWGERSLVLPALEEFRASPAGRGWVEAAEDYRAALGAALRSATLVVGQLPAPGSGRAPSDLYAIAGERWIRLTRTGGALAGALPATGASLVAYVAVRSSPARAGAAIPEVRIGVVDLATGVAAREVIVREVRELTLAWRPRAGEPHLEAVWTPGTGRKQAAEIDWRTARRVTIDRPRAVVGERLVVDAQGVVRRRLPLAGVVADWDAGAASAMRMAQTGKVVAAPGGRLIDGDTVVRSPDGARLAFAAAAAPCDAEDDAAPQLYVAEAATGRVRALAGGDVSGPQWLDDDRVAFTDGARVRIAAAATAKATGAIDSARGRVATITATGPRRCADEPPPPFAGVAPPDEPPVPFDDTVQNSSDSVIDPKDERVDGGSVESSE